MKTPYTQKPLCSLKRGVRRIGLVTTTRADWGLLSPLAHRIHNDNALELYILASGTHLSAHFGTTLSEIEQEGLKVYKSIPILQEGDSKATVAKNISVTLEKFTECFLETPFDIILLLGDRYEAMGVALAASNLNIPIAHICGGERTEGANDEYLRHCITKMSYLHFTTTQEYKNRVIQLGESPNRVFNVGSLSVENIHNTPLMDKQDLADFLHTSKDFLQKFCILTYHSVTLEDSNPEKEIQTLLETLLTTDYNLLATKTNADYGGGKINALLEKYAQKYPQKMLLKSSLGRVGYLSALQFADFMIGNSSSGVIEAPIMQTPTINIGNRQKGRITSPSVLHIPLDKQAILQAVKDIKDFKKHDLPHPFGRGDSSRQIVETLKLTLSNPINLQKSFYDLPYKFYEK